LLFEWVGLIVQNIAVKEEFNQELRGNGVDWFLKLLAFPNRLQNPNLLDAIGKSRKVDGSGKLYLS
jgi:hypothetical protein